MGDTGVTSARRHESPGTPQASSLAHIQCVDHPTQQYFRLGLTGRLKSVRPAQLESSQDGVGRGSTTTTGGAGGTTGSGAGRNSAM
ncbi:MAG: hypothetical protein KDD51_03240, partial [Bdellovibrionales bacterium]|nr:hypothetical protein [Bdellovibrionales bacterium]